MTAISLGPSPTRRDALTRRIRLLVTATITYNVFEAIVAVTAGTLASSTALVGFGLDSVIEVSSAAAVAWQFSARDHAAREGREKTALRITAVSFFALAAYVTIDAVRALTGIGEAERSIPGIVLAALSLAVMPFLSAAQRRAGRELGSASAVADSMQTLLCTYLSAVLLAGLVLNAALGWSWADPISGLVIAAVTCLAGSAGVLLLQMSTPVAWIVVITLVFGVTLGAGVSANQTALYTQIPADQIGTASGMFRTWGYIGSIASAAIISISFHSGVSDHGLHAIALIMVIVSVLVLLFTVGDRHLMALPRVGQDGRTSQPADEKPNPAPATAQNNTQP